MIISSVAPLRLSIVGGGTDMEPFASQSGGLCINFSLNLRQHLTLYTGKDDLRVKNDVLGNPAFFDHILQKYHCRGVVKQTCDAEIGSGLGSSASAAVALLAAIHTEQETEYTLSSLAEEAFSAENEMGWYGGRQDQYAAAYGGCNVMQFGAGVMTTPLSKGFVEPLSKAIVLYYVGKRKDKSPQTHLQEPTKKQLEALQQIKELAVGGIDAVGNADWKTLGGLLDLSWKQKKLSNPSVSNSDIDMFYTHAMESGALGGKVCGAGSGGYMFFIINPQQRKDFLQKMEWTNLKQIDFGFDWGGCEVRRLL